MPELMDRQRCDSRAAKAFADGFDAVAGVRGNWRGRFTAFGEERFLFEWLRDSRCVVSARAVGKRLAEGMSFEQAISMPPRRPRLAFPVGAEIGSLVVISERSRRFSANGSVSYWVKCRCKCGEVVDFNINHLARAVSPSCGCDKRKRTQENKARAYRAWAIKNRERRREYIREWKRRNPGRVASYQESRRDIHDWSEADSELVNQVYRHARSDAVIPCYLCGRDTTKDGRHVEHKTPRSRGGPHIASNLGIACIDCNLKKHDKTVAEFHAA